MFFPTGERESPRRDRGVQGEMLWSRISPIVGMRKGFEGMGWNVKGTVPLLILVKHLNSSLRLQAKMHPVSAALLLQHRLKRHTVLVYAQYS